ncbi:MAG: hypothetical protein ABSG15_15300 [FCB group bacterium]|jgi:hypothetical protein
MKKKHMQIKANVSEEGAGFPDEIVPNAIASIRLPEIPNPNKTLFLEEIPMRRQYRDETNVIVVSCIRYLSHHSM